jgi:hypothetical protein
MGAVRTKSLSGKGGVIVLFVALLNTRPGSTFREGAARRLQWDYPEGVEVVAEYWLETDSPRVVAILEAEGMAPLEALRMDWGDLFEIRVYPAVTGEQGMEMLRHAMSQQG